MRLRRRRYAVRNKIVKILLAAVYITVLAMVGLGFNGTYSIFSTLARTPPGEARAAGTEDLLVVSGKFDLEEWLQTGESGLTVTNVSKGNLWLYFTVEGDLGGAIRHINPVKLNAGQNYQVPLKPAAVGELGLLGWKNNGDVFEGKIIARVLNNFSAWEVGTVTIPGKELYEKMVAEQDDPAGELPGVKSVADVIRLIAEKTALAEERDRLLQERDELLEANSALQRKNAELENKVEYLGASLSATRETISGLKQQPPAPEQQPQPGNSATPPEQGGQPDKDQQPGGNVPDQGAPEGPSAEPGAGLGGNPEEPASEPGEQPGIEAPQEPESDPAAGTEPEVPQERDNGGAEEPGKDDGETGSENTDSDNGGEGSTSGGTDEGSMPDSVESGGGQGNPGNDAGGAGDGAGQNTPQHGQSVAMPDVIQPAARQPRGMPEKEEKPEI